MKPYFFIGVASGRHALVLMVKCPNSRADNATNCMLNQDFFESLETLYGKELALAMIKPRQLPIVPEIKLLLLTDDYPKDRLGQESYIKLMAAPPYWAFCWGGGQAMARYLLDHPELVDGKTVVDFGSGSGVAGIAAAKSGADHVVGVDIDPVANSAARANAQLNNIEMSLLEYYPADGRSLVLAADICYEEEGLVWVQQHLENGGDLIVSDSRIEQLAQKLPRVSQVNEITVKTFPDLDEDSCFSNVKLYSTL